MKLLIFTALVLCCALAASFSHADGAAAAQPTSERTVKLWNIADGREAGLNLEGRHNVNSLAFSPDGLILAGGTGDSIVQLWDAKTGRLLRTLRSHTQSVEAVAFSPDGKLLASASYDRTVKLWDVATRELARTLGGHERPVRAVAFSPDGARLASGDDAGVTKIWNLRTGASYETQYRHQAAVTSVAFAPDGHTLATGSADKTVRIWGANSGEKGGFVRLGEETLTQGRDRLTGHTDAVESVAFAPDGVTLATASRDQTIKLWDISLGRELRTLLGHASAVNRVAFSPDGRRLASGSYDRTIKIWDVAAGRELRTLAGHGRQINALAFSPDGRTLASGSAATRTDNPTLHVLAIGVHEHSVKDATEVARAFERLGRGEFERVETTLLLDADATRANIIAALNKVAAEAKPQDTFVFYYSGGGISVAGKTAAGNEFLLMPSDFDLERLEKTAITASRLSTLLAKVEAAHQLVTLDSNGSDTAFESLTARVRRENDALAGLLQRDLTILAAESSLERGRLNSGALTYAILHGLRGEAASRDGVVTARSLAAFLAKPTRELRDKFPRVGFKTFGAGGDFTLGRVTPEGASRRPSAPPRLGLPTLAAAVNMSWGTDFPPTAAPSFPSPTPSPTPLQTPTPTLMPTPTPEAVRDTIPLRPPELAATPEPRKGKDYALLIAVSEYDHWTPLTNPVFDAEAIAKELREVYKFETELLRNPTKQEITRALLKYRREIAFSDEDQLFIFFAGHGHFNEDIKEGYLIARDSLKADEVGDTYFSHSILRKIIDSIPCKHIFLVIDACYSGTFDEQIARRGPEEPYADATNLEFIRRKMQFKTRQFLTSGDKVYVPDGRPGQHSPFARKFLEALRSYGGRDGLLTITGIYAYVERVTPEPRRGEWGGNEPGSDFLFEAKPAPQP